MNSSYHLFLKFTEIQLICLTLLMVPSQIYFPNSAFPDLYKAWDQRGRVILIHTNIPLIHASKISFPDILHSSTRPAAFLFLCFPFAFSGPWYCFCISQDSRYIPRHLSISHLQLRQGDSTGKGHYYGDENNEVGDPKDAWVFFSFLSLIYFLPLDINPPVIDFFLNSFIEI